MRARHPRHHVDVVVRHHQTGPTRGQDTHVGTGRQEPSTRTGTPSSRCSQLSTTSSDVAPPASDAVSAASDIPWRWVARTPHGGRRRDHRGVLVHAVHEQTASATAHRLRGHRHGEPGLADAPRADRRHQTVRANAVDERAHLDDATHGGGSGTGGCGRARAFSARPRPRRGRGFGGRRAAQLAQQRGHVALHGADGDEHASATARLVRSQRQPVEDLLLTAWRSPQHLAPSSRQRLDASLACVDGVNSTCTSVHRIRRGPGCAPVPRKARSRRHVNDDIHPPPPRPSPRTPC